MQQLGIAQKPLGIALSGVHPGRNLVSSQLSSILVSFHLRSHSRLQATIDYLVHFREFSILLRSMGGLSPKWFRRFVRRFLFETIHDMAVMIDRGRVGREESPSAGVIDSQSVKAPSAGVRGYDAGKKIVGRKRHIAVDTDGRLLMINLTTADISDSAGAQMILDQIRKRWPWVKHLFADGAYDRRTLMDKAAYKDFVIEVIKRIDGQKGFEVLPQRWVVERTFGWMTRWRRLVRDYEKRIDVSKAMIHVAMGSLLWRRIVH